jgi:hypothetical protein
MKVRSLLFSDWLDEEDILRHECSDRVWIPKHMFERWLLEEDAGTIIVATLETIAVCIYGPHSGPTDTIYAPSWICQSLGTSDYNEEDDYIVPIRFKPQTCSFLTLQPITSHHLRTVREPEEALALGMEQYTCIQKDQTLDIRLETGDVMSVRIVDVLPETEEPVCIRNPTGELELSLELLPPLDMPLPVPPLERAPTPPPSPPALLSEPEATPGYQINPDAKPLTKEEIRQQRCRMFQENQKPKPEFGKN